MEAAVKMVGVVLPATAAAVVVAGFAENTHEMSLLVTMEAKIIFLLFSTATRDVEAVDCFQFGGWGSYKYLNCRMATEAA